MLRLNSWFHRKVEMSTRNLRSQFVTSFSVILFLLPLNDITWKLIVISRKRNIRIRNQWKIMKANKIWEARNLEALFKRITNIKFSWEYSTLLRWSKSQTYARYLVIFAMSQTSVWVGFKVLRFLVLWQR